MVGVCWLLYQLGVVPAVPVTLDISVSPAQRRVTLVAA